MSYFRTIDGARPFSLRKNKRRKTQSILNPYLFRGKRKHGRRSSEKASSYVDRFSRIEYFLVFSILILAFLDGFFTSFYLANGAQEANPFLNIFYQKYGTLGLMIVKYAITFPALLFILMHMRFPYTRKSAKFILFTYCILSLYHIWGLFLI